MAIFGTDLSEAAIEKARAGIYSDNITDEVSGERLRRYFTRLDQRYQIAKSLRDMCIFSRHDVTFDPPFSRLDLITCRNLLIYLDQPLQQRVLPLFHYALKPKAFLMLGPSESVGITSSFFQLADSRGNIYRSKKVEATLPHAEPRRNEIVAPPLREAPAEMIRRNARPNACCSRAKGRPAYWSTIISTYSISMAKPAATWSMRADRRV
jgi:hypothetical protein